MSDKLGVILGEKISLSELSNIQRARLIFAIADVYGLHLKGFGRLKSLNDLQNNDFGRWKSVTEESAKVTYSKGISPNTECVFLDSCSVAKEPWDVGQEVLIFLSKGGEIIRWDCTFHRGPGNFYHKISDISLFSLPSVRTFSFLLHETGTNLYDGVIKSLIKLSEELQTQRNREMEAAARIAEKIKEISSRMNF